MPNLSKNKYINSKCAGVRLKRKYCKEVRDLLKEAGWVTGGRGNENPNRMVHVEWISPVDNTRVHIFTNRTSWIEYPERDVVWAPTSGADFVRTVRRLVADTWDLMVKDSDFTKRPKDTVLESPNKEYLLDIAHYAYSFYNRGFNFRIYHHLPGSPSEPITVQQAIEDLQGVTR